MPNLFCFGLSDTAEHYIRAHGQGFDRIAGTVRGAARANRISGDGLGGRRVQAIAFDGAKAAPDIAAPLATTDFLLVSIPPDDDGDPVLRHYAEALAAAPRLAVIVYLSTIGVYGDHGGAWIDETATPAPVSGRSRARLGAEQAWQVLAARTGRPLAILRLAGIYGPGRNALVQVANGSAKRIVKPGQVFNRIHVGDIAQVIEAAFSRRADGIFNVTDDEPTPPGDPVVFAARLLDIAPPPEVPFVEAARTMSPMALSFYGETKRVRNDKIKAELGVRLNYPTYREGLRALFAADATPANGL
jgi:nucleoside-diphosphate-sugar epimerase